MSGQKIRDGASWYCAAQVRPKGRKTVEVLDELAGGGTFSSNGANQPPAGRAGASAPQESAPLKSSPKPLIPGDILLGGPSPPEGRPRKQEGAQECEAVDHAPQERRVGHGGKHPETNMEIAVIARRRVRGMIQVLNDIAREKKNPCSARVSAAKAIIDFARLKQDDVKDLTDHEIRELARQIVEGRASSLKEGRALSKAVGLGSKKSSKAPAKGPTKH